MVESFRKIMMAPRVPAMNRAYSVYLDAARATAALVVFLHHFAFDNFTDGRYSIINAHRFGADAVIIFFVLSGLIIAYCGDEKDKRLGDFAFSRATRLYSVAIPALIIGWLADAHGSSNYPEYYEKIWFEPVSFAQQMLSGLTFSNEWVFTRVRLGSNGPYWSLSFEVAYYMIFAAAFYLGTRWKWGLVAVIAIVLGPAGMVLFPCWLVGLLVWKTISSGVSLTKRTSVMLTAIPLVIYLALIGTRSVGTLQMISEAIMPDVLYGPVRTRADNYLWFNIIGLLAALHLLGVHGLLKNAQVPDRSKMVIAIRFIASCSFSIYLLHYPVLHVLSPTWRVMPSGVMRDAVLGASALAVCILVAVIFERTLGLQRRVLKNFPIGSTTKRRAS